MSLSLDEKEIMRIVAAVTTLHGTAVVSRLSAAALWGMPRLGAPPKRVHVTDSRITQTVQNAFTVKHAGSLGPAEVAERFGVLVTTPTRTALDIALTASFRQSVVVLDHCLRSGLVTKDGLRRDLERQPTARGSARAARAIDFADHRANRPGESLSRVVMLEARIEAPELQAPFDGPDSQHADVDFFWPGLGLVGEFDGMTKYRDSGRWSGLKPHEVVIAEKVREDWIRADPAVRGFVRWTWHDVVASGRLAALLSAAMRPRLR
ncbi:hypothetical protein [Frondihabitans sp. PhB188]|uniref:hypothetical protein n=1 Tax=Frondihabitans sp. PhB188 TaxID=2485200 RepID=UPI000F463EB4|nr:hypothetical protein [Frondihabitans sp. PhB188]